MHCKPIPPPVVDPHIMLSDDFMDDPRLKEMDDCLDGLFEYTDTLVTSLLEKESKSRKSHVCYKTEKQ